MAHLLARWAIASATTAATMLGGWPAHAALVDDYSQSDDVWNTPVPAGHVLVDVRSTYPVTTSPGAIAPALSVVVGLPGTSEVGAWSGYALTGSSPGATLVNPYLKIQLPWTLDGVGLGLVAGAQVPLQAGVEHDVALEGVALVTLPGNWSLDANLGVGRSFVTPATLGHALVALYDGLSGGRSLLLEASLTSSTATSPVWYEHVGLLQPLEGTWTFDAGVGLTETAGAASLVPQLGTTVTF